MSQTTTKKTKEQYPLWAALSFVVVLVVIGIPVWWQTTAVKRAPLPIEEIEELDFEDYCAQSFKVLFTSPSEESSFCDISTKLFPATSIKKVCLPFTDVENGILNLDYSLKEADEKLLSSHISDRSKYDLVFVKVPYEDGARSTHIIQGKGKYVYITYDAERMLLNQPVSSSQAKSDDKLPLAQHYNFLLTLATHNAEDIDEPTIATTVHAHLSPLFEKLRPAVSFTVESQVIFFGNSHVKTAFNNDTGSYVLTEDDVTSLINAFDLKTGSILSLYPTFHWVWYIPYHTQVPLKIHRDGKLIPSNTVISPRWNGGGLQIVNNEFNIPGVVALLTQQLKEALGISVQTNYLDDLEIPWTTLNEEPISDWELKSHLKQRTCEYLRKTSATLKSLVKLLSQIENIVVSDQIKDAIEASVKNAHDSKEAIETGDWLKAHVNAASSFEKSEEAFFDPSLLALLYFPDDQKYAIYIPLFLPVGIPIVLSLRSIIQQLFQSKGK